MIQPPFPQAQGKLTLFEGGVRVPFIVAGASVASGNYGTTESFAQAVDVFATIAEIAAQGPIMDLEAVLARDVDGLAGDDKVPLDGISLVPVLNNRTQSPRSFLYSEYFVEGNQQQWTWTVGTPSRWNYNGRYWQGDGSGGYTDTGTDLVTGGARVLRSQYSQGGVTADFKLWHHPQASGPTSPNVWGPLDPGGRHVDPYDCLFRLYEVQGGLIVPVDEFETTNLIRSGYTMTDFEYNAYIGSTGLAARLETLGFNHPGR